MEDAMEIVPSSSSSEPLDLDTIRSRATELENMATNWNEGELESEKLLGDWTLNFKTRFEEMVSEWLDANFLDDKDFEACLKRLGEELNSTEAENTKLSENIELLSRTQAEDLSRLETEFESLKCLLDFPSLQDPEKANVGLGDDFTGHSNNQSKSMNDSGGDESQLLELENELKKKHLTLKTFEDLDCIFKWFDVTEQIEDSFTGVKFIAVEENCIRLSLETYFPTLEILLSQQVLEAVRVPFDGKYELLIEFLEGTMNPKNVEIFPNDVSINDVLIAAKDFGKPLQWIVTKVHYRIVLCTMRRLVVNRANASGYSLEYMDKDEIVVAHLTIGVDVFIKVSQGWPISKSPLELQSVKSSNHYATEISSSFLIKVKEEANSLAVHIRHNLSSFVDNVEKILK